MKIRVGFVSNSSSTAFMITNLTDEEKTLVDFVTETPWIIKAYKKMYDIEDFEKTSQGYLMISAERHNITFKPHESKVCNFGDEDGTLIGRVYDYMLRGKVKNISEKDKLLNQLIEAIHPDEIKRISEEWMRTEDSEDDKNNLTGVDSPSFKVRFHGWNR